jgi:hypothetical protein
MEERVMRKLFILFAAVAFAFAFTTPAKAEVNFSGFVAFETYMESCDEVAPALDEDDLIWTLDRTCSRLSVNFSEGPVAGYVEIRPNVGSYVRHWWASWNFGAGTFGIGQTWTPEFSCIGSVKRGCGVAGPLDPACSARIPFAQVQFGGLKIAAGEPNTPAAPQLGIAGYDDIETSLPKLMASYNLNVGMVGLKFFGGYNTYAERNPANDQTQDIDSMVYGLTASAGFGPLTVKGMIWGGENTAEYGAGAPAFNAVWNGSSVVDASAMFYGIDVAYAVSDTLKVAAGYQTGEAESDLPGTYEDPTTTYFVNATFTLAKGVTITPEYAVVDDDDVTVAGVKTEECKTSWIGVYWQINF